MVIAGLGSTAKLAGCSTIGGLLSAYLGTAGKDLNLSYREWTWEREREREMGRERERERWKLSTVVYLSIKMIQSGRLGTRARIQDMVESRQ